MDAKPQRPFRPLRVLGDENLLAPINPAGKTLHHRNKSTPALSTLGEPGGVKNAVKRTAFGDLSNTANTTRPTRDDPAVPSKGLSTVTEKPTALSRPAQRPLSVAGAKLAQVSASNFNVNVIGPNTNHSALDKLPGNPRKAITKRNTVFKDTALPSAVESEPITSQTHKTSAPAVNNKGPVDHVAQRSATIASNNTAVNDKPVNAAQANNPMKKDLQHSSVSISSEEPAALRSDGVYIKENGEVKSYSHHEKGHIMHEKPMPSSNAQPVLTSDVEVVSTKHVTEHRAIVSENSDPSRLKHDHVHLASEPEEYWDDEDDDNYEEDGYVTARSHRSRDNTTGGATVLLMPKVTQKVQRELSIAKEIVEATRTPEDIEDEAWDTSMVAEYGDEIFQYMRELEMRLLPNAHYMDNQAEIQWSMRSVLMDWLVQVHHRFSLLPETLFLCVNYIDRFLSCKIVSLGKLQLVGATAIFIAAKYEEINCPSLQEIIYMVDNGYTADEILKAERFMLSMLQFELGWPGPMSFLRRISKADDYDLETRTLAKYFLEITIMDERFVGTPPSFTAAGAHCLARLMLRKGTWTPAHVYYSNYTYSQLYPLVSLILECCEDPMKHHSAVYEKYSDRRFKRASTFVKGEMMKKFKLPEAAREGSAAHLINLFEDASTWRRQ
ncbi:G2/mitotic-specific cyclin cdc13 [Blastomyces gilchristii SLH14081]|uniref:G2/mitotic-specific cyclin cdc13 n=1 Tax=Blastomyces gilchristii (strain SLH14081) TaxID=559298 RepID=A0A179UGY8_BLAGS|nr:G2/mitotic-specific cyclin cdc13 [Blastomyces gilchristii SLH14081]OAT06528.1 G2/mitotic-specific cyclin cdc13 [Blastomyces gilchristii SLH14081]